VFIFIRRKNPLLTKDRRKAYLSDVNLKEADDEDIDDNILIMGPMGPVGSFMGFHPETRVLYFIIDPDENKQVLRDIIMGDAESDIFPVFPNRRAIGGPGTINMFWKSSKQKRRFLKAIAGAVQFIVEPNSDVVIITHMATKRGWKRRGVNSAMISKIMRKYPDRRIVYHGLTDQGRKFMQSFGGEEYIRPNPEENGPYRIKYVRSSVPDPLYLGPYDFYEDALSKYTQLLSRAGVISVEIEPICEFCNQIGCDLETGWACDEAQMRRNPDWPFMYHITTLEAVPDIQRDGLKIDQSFVLTEGGQWAVDHYGANPVYLSENPWVTKAQTIAWGDENKEPVEFALLKVNVEGLPLVADLPSLVDKGGLIDEEGISWVEGQAPPDLEPYLDIEDNYSQDLKEVFAYYDYLITPGHSVAEAAIQATRTAACLENIPAHRIQYLGTAFR
jgi:hypothetical protein